MAQVTIYIPNELETHIKDSARSLGISVSKFITAVLTQKVKNEWGDDIRKLSGTWQDFPSLDSIRAAEGIDAPRESF